MPLKKWFYRSCENLYKLIQGNAASIYYDTNNEMVLRFEVFAENELVQSLRSFSQRRLVKK
jgi:hypothetical protein